MSRLSNRPLLDTRIDMELYEPRAAAEAALDRAARNGWNVALTGPRGSGKTTALRAWAYQNRRGRAQVVSKDQVDRLTLLNAVFVPAGAATDAIALLEAVLVSLVRGGHDQAAVAEQFRRDSDGGRGDVGRASDLIDVLRRIVESDDPTGGAPLTLVVDDVDPVAGHQLFGVLRDELWTVPVQWIVAVDSAKAPQMLQPPADAFFEATVELAPLSADEAARLLERRLATPFYLDLDEVFPEGILPRDLIRLAQQGSGETEGDFERGSSVSEASFRAALTALSRRDNAIARLGAPAVALARAMDDLGPVSPSDARLLAQLRWTRARVSQVMKQLAGAGLVEYTTAVSSGPGRPARLYRLVTPEDFLSKQAVL